MKKRNLLKRIAAIAMSAAMVLGMASAVNAADVTPTPSAGNVPMQDTGSLQIIKRKTGDIGGVQGGIKDVQFTYVKVGDFNFTVNTDGTKTAVNGFTFSESSGKTLEDILTNDDSMGENVLEPVDTLKDTAIYDGQAIQKALEYAVSQESLLTQIKEISGTEFNLTDENGETNKVENLPIGIYLIVETEAPSQVTKLSDPFLVSVPILNQDTQTWDYDVVAYPKNDYIPEAPEPEKTIIDEEGKPVKDPSAIIGEEITYEIKANVPKIQGSLERFDFVDTLSDGLDFADNMDLKVYATENAGADPVVWTELTQDEDYTVTKNNKVLTISFKIDSIKNCAEVKATYQAVLNENAIISINSGTNENTFKVEYSNNPDTEYEEVTEEVDTYGFTLQKNDENSSALAGAKFELYDAKVGGNKVPFYTAVNKETGKPTGYQVTEVTTDKAGQASFYGLKAGTYYLEEVEAPEGYNPLKERVEIVVSEETTVFVDGQETVDITVVNTKGFTLPETGGMGTTIFTIGGIVLMAGAAVLIVRMNRKEKEK